jgi:hypothetical protein
MNTKLEFVEISFVMGDGCNHGNWQIDISGFCFKTVYATRNPA